MKKEEKSTEIELHSSALLNKVGVVGLVAGAIVALAFWVKRLKG